MTVNKFKNLLKQKGINIHQMEDVANEKLDRLDSFFNVKSKEIFGYALTRNSFRNKLKQKSKNVGDPLNELSNILENINIKDFDQLDRSIKEMESAIEKLKNVVDNIWTDEDKEQLNDLMGAYFQLNIKNKISVRIITVLTKNEYLKLLFQLIIFLLTCFGTKLFSPALQKIYSTLGEQKADFISALIRIFGFHIFQFYL